MLIIPKSWLWVVHFGHCAELARRSQAVRISNHEVVVPPNANRMPRLLHSRQHHQVVQRERYRSNDCCHLHDRGWRKDLRPQHYRIRLCRTRSPPPVNATRVSPIFWQTVVVGAYTVLKIPACFKPNKIQTPSQDLVSNFTDNLLHSNKNRFH